MFRAWLRRQHASYLAALLALVAAPHAPGGVQAAAVAAVMEAVRCQDGPGSFAADLYGRLVGVVAALEGVKPEVRGGIDTTVTT